MGPKNMNSAPSGNNNGLSAKEQYYKDQHDARVAQLAQFRMNNFKDSNGESVDRGEKVNWSFVINLIKLNLKLILS